MIRALLALSLISHVITGFPSDQTQPFPGFKLETVLNYEDLHAFTWDDHGNLWFLSGKENRLTVSTMPDPKAGIVKPIHTFERRGNGPSGLLVNADTIFVSDGDAIRAFEIDSPGRERSPFVLPSNLFPPRSHITSLHWSPLGPISFIYHSRGESGVGRMDLHGQRWDAVVKGVSGKLTHDLNGLAIIADTLSSNLFRVAPGLDYEHGLQNYKKTDLALRLDPARTQPTFALLYSGMAWAATNYGSWLLFDAGTSALQQFTEENGSLKFRRNVVQMKGHTTISDGQIGPDGALWILVVPGSDSHLKTSSLVRLLDKEHDRKAASPTTLSKLSSADLVAQFSNLNSWHRDTALRVLDFREDLGTVRGLHPSSPLHDTLHRETNSPMARVYAMISLYRLGLLDEVTCEAAAEDRSPILCIWGALLFGERNYPTGTAFEMLTRLSKGTNSIAVRSAAAVAARQFVSGSLAVDTTPRTMPIREVWTGGILSTLWFSTEHGSSPEFDLLYWNAVRPITAFDHAHPLGFLNGDNDSKLTIAYWIAGLIGGQITESDDQLKQQDAMLVVAELNPKNPRMIIATLEGLTKGRRKVTPTSRSLEVLSKLTKSTEPEIANLSRDLLANWTSPFRP